ncbi:hypothetical protein DFH06DRAFT_676286, partial [Mycena polygramma]
TTPPLKYSHLPNSLPTSRSPPTRTTTYDDALMSSSDSQSRSQSRSSRSPSPVPEAAPVPPVRPTIEQRPSSRRRERRRQRTVQSPTPSETPQTPQSPFSPSPLRQQQPSPFDDPQVGQATQVLGNTLGQALGGPRPSQPSTSLKLRLDLNLDIEVSIKAKIHGDVTLSLLYVPFPLLSFMNSRSFSSKTMTGRTGWGSCM